MPGDQEFKSLIINAHMWHAGKYLVRVKSSVTECVSDWLIEIVFTTLQGEMPSFGQKNILIFTYQNRILYNKNKQYTTQC